MRSLMNLVVRTVITVLVATSGYGRVPPPSYQFSSGGAALNIPVELIANGLVFVNAKVNGHAGWCQGSAAANVLHE
jgi:hypothetical protein